MKTGKVLAFTGLVAAGAIAAAMAVPGAPDDDRDRNWHARSQVIVIDGDGNQNKRIWSDDWTDDNGFLGVFLEDADGDGARIHGILDDSAAEAAGLKNGDVIVGANGQEVHDARDLTRALRDLQPGDQVDLDVERDGQRQSFTAELGEHPHGMAFSFGDHHFGDFDFEFDMEGLEDHLAEMQEKLQDMDLEDLGPGFTFRFGGGRPMLGIQVIEPTPELREFMGGPEDAGVLVGKVKPGSPAEEAGLKVGDLITALDGRVIESHGDLLRELQGRDGESVTLEIVRDGRTTTLDVLLPEREQPRRDRGHDIRYELPTRNFEATRT